MYIHCVDLLLQNNLNFKDLKWVIKKLVLTVKKMELFTYMKKDIPKKTGR